MDLKLKWINAAKGESDPTIRGYWRSLEGRFTISPSYRHTVYPDSYKLCDNLKAEKRDISCDTVREAKDRAALIVQTELANA